MTTLNQEQHHKAENARHWTEQAQQPASEPMTWRDCLRAKRPKAQNPEAGIRAEEARAWAESPEPESTTKGKVSGRQTAWILAALLIGLPLVLLVFGSWLKWVVFWVAIAALAPLMIVFMFRAVFVGSPDRVIIAGDEREIGGTPASYIDGDGEYCDKYGCKTGGFRD
ncbi:hypothetical protein [Alloalcanivorax xenomutans]|uniref:hypothetical protein n=1 Tax=Alloalcanivorax xenomutans TaxID=1094342 RepID=UPI001F178C49|nr:hypothetical protein [Alloalcanivorax xenomutans]MCE7525104.1 hypothetical protein [Alloalcanivorax xenomutans]